MALYHRALICQRFPAYKLHELRDLPAAELLWAMQLLSTAEEEQAERQRLVQTMGQ